MKDEADLLSGIADDFARDRRDGFIDRFERLSRRCESPIERVLLCALLARQNEITRFVDVDKNLPFEELRLYVNRPDHSDQVVVIYTQCWVGDYRVDFYVEQLDISARKAWFRAVIECDGHDFHEKTKEQVRRDKQRDRWFQSRGIAVYRFAGSEIWNNPAACAEQLFEACWQAYCRQYLSGYNPLAGQQPT
jgi:very-short-patch-repair endonuclease